MVQAAWDLRNDPDILVGIIHVETTTVAWSLGLRALKVPGRFQDPLCVTGMPYDHGRNSISQMFLESGASALFFLDSDLVVPRDTIMRLWKHNLPVVSGLYYRRSPPEGIPVMQKPVGHWLTDGFKKGSLVEVDVVGAGCFLIRREVLEKCPPQKPGKPWFNWLVDDLSCPREKRLSEDFSFQMHIKETMGIKTYVDTSIECRHIGFGEATKNSFKPLNTIAIN